MSTRSLLLVALVVVLVVAAAGIVIGLSLRRPGGPATGRQAAASGSHAARTPARGPGSTAAPGRSGTPGKAGNSGTAGKAGTGGTGGTAGKAAKRTGTATSTTGHAATVPPPSPGSPRLASIAPASGAAGRTIVVDGSGLFSSNGEVAAYFGSTIAPTSCNSQTSCTVTVPDLGSQPSSWHLTVVTASGRSNALVFSYR